MHSFPLNPRSLSVVLLSVFLTCFTQELRSDSEELRDRFFKEYPKALIRLEDRYSHIRGSGVETVERKVKNGPKSTSDQVTFQVDGDLIRVSRAKVGPGQKPPSIRAASTEYAFHADQRLGSDDFVLKRLQAREKNGIHDISDGLRIFRRRYLNAPFVAMIPVSQFLWDPAIAKIDQVIPVVRNGKNLVEVKYKRRTTIGREKAPATFDGTLVLSPDDAWVVLESKVCAPKMSCAVTTVDYGPAVDGIPLPKRVTISEGDLQKTTFDFESFTFTPSGPGDYMLASVGLPELPVPGKQRSGTVIWAFLVVPGVLLGIAALVLRKRSYQHGIKSDLSGDRS
jgi:hypothetical protein